MPRLQKFTVIIKKKMIESLDLKPKSLYGHTKILGENLVKTYSDLLGFDYLIFRFFNICGQGQREDFVISKFFKDIKEKKEMLYMDLVHKEDLSVT